MRTRKCGALFVCALELCLLFSGRGVHSESLHIAVADADSPVSAAVGIRRGWPAIAPTPPAPRHRPSSSGSDRCSSIDAPGGPLLRSRGNTSANRSDCATSLPQALSGLAKDAHLFC